MNLVMLSDGVDKADVKRRERIVNSLAPINDNYVWEVAACESKTSVPRTSLFLVKIMDDTTVRLGEQVLRDLTPSIIEVASYSLVNMFPEAKMFEPKLDDNKCEELLMLGVYSSVGFTPQEFTTQQTTLIEAEDIDFAKIQERRESIGQALAPVKENYVWRIIEPESKLDCGKYALWLEEIDEDVNIRIYNIGIGEMTEKVIHSNSTHLLKSYPQATSNLTLRNKQVIKNFERKTQKRRIEDDTSMFGFYIHTQNDAKETETQK